MMKFIFKVYAAVAVYHPKAGRFVNPQRQPLLSYWRNTMNLERGLPQVYILCSALHETSGY